MNTQAMAAIPPDVANTNPIPLSQDETESLLDIKHGFRMAMNEIGWMAYDANLLLDKKTGLSHALSGAGLLASAASLAVPGLALVANVGIEAAKTVANATRIYNEKFGPDVSLLSPTTAFNHSAEYIKTAAKNLLKGDDAKIAEVEKTADRIKNSIQKIINGDGIQAIAQPALSIAGGVTGAVFGGLVGASIGMAPAYGEEILYNRWRTGQWNKIDAGFKTLTDIFTNGEKVVDDRLEAAGASPRASITPPMIQ